MWLLYLAVIVGLVPVFGALSLWLQILLSCSLIVAFMADRHKRVVLNNLLGAGLALVGLVVYLPQLTRANVALPLIHILCLLLVVRILGRKSARNILQSFLLAVAVLAASSLLELSMIYLFCLILLVLLLSSSLILLSFIDGQDDLELSSDELKSLLRPILLLPGASLVLMAMLFVILPRTQAPFWNFLNPSPQATVSLSDQVSPGDFSDLALSGEVAFRVETERLPVGQEYWRGLVLNQIDQQGRRWSRQEPDAKERSRLQGQPVSLTVFAEAKVDRYLVTLDRTVELGGVRHRQSEDGTMIASRIEQGRQRYQLKSYPGASFELAGSADAYLQLPESSLPRLAAVARQIVSETTTMDRIAALDRFFLSLQLVYSSRQLEQTDAPVETFLFETKRGYCEYFASSYALLLRMSGVPARLVGGYLGGAYNTFGGYYLVSEDSAHVWVEALDDEGVWQRIDPSRFAVNAESAISVGRNRNIPVFRALSDYLFYLWTRAVLNYDFSQQFNLFRNVSAKLRGGADVDMQLDKTLSWGGLVLLVILLWLLYRSQQISSLIRAYRKQIARCCGVRALPTSLGLYRIAERSGHPLCREFAENCGAVLYGERKLSWRDRRRLRKIISALRRQRFDSSVAQ